MLFSRALWSSLWHAAYFPSQPLRHRPWILPPSPSLPQVLQCCLKLPQICLLNCLLLLLYQSTKWSKKSTYIFFSFISMFYSAPGTLSRKRLFLFLILPYLQEVQCSPPPVSAQPLPCSSARPSSSRESFSSQFWTINEETGNKEKQITIKTSVHGLYQNEKFSCLENKYKIRFQVLLTGPDQISSFDLFRSHE